MAIIVIHNNRKINVNYHNGEKEHDKAGNIEMAANGS
jgi:hypothetical protein